MSRHLKSLARELTSRDPGYAWPAYLSPVGPEVWDHVSFTLIDLPDSSFPVEGSLSKHLREEET